MPIRRRFLLTALATIVLGLLSGRAQAEGKQRIQGLILDGKRATAGARIETFALERVDLCSFEGLIAGRRITPLAVARAQANGAFDLTLPATGSYGFTAMSPEGRVGEVLLSGDYPDITLSQGAFISGRVTDERGAPVPNAVVVGRTDNELVPFPVEERPRGAFVAGPVAQRNGTLFAGAPGYSIESATLPPRGDVHIVLRKQPTLRGTLSHQGHPAARAQVRLIERVPRDSPHSDGCAHELTADGEGRFSFTGPPGQYRLEATTSDGYELRLSPVIVGPNDTRESFEMVPSPVVTGLVTEDGRPVHGVTVEVSEGNQPIGKATTDREGRYRLTVPLSDRHLSPQVKDENYVQVGSSSWGGVDISVRRLAKMAGRVVDEAGRGLPGAKVSAEMYLHGSPVLTVPDTSGTTDADGHFALRTPNGAARLLVHHPSWPRTFFPVEAPTDKARLVLRWKDSFRGRVEDEHGHPVQARVFLYALPRYTEFGYSTLCHLSPLLGTGRGEDRPVSWGETDETGAFAIPAPAKEGSFTLYIRRARSQDLSIPIQWPIAQPFVVRMPPGHAITGWVSDEEGRVVEGATIEATLQGTERQARPPLLAPGEMACALTTSSGEHLFALPHLAPRPYKVTAAKVGYLPATVVLTPGSGDQQVTLKRLGVIRGRVVDSIGREVPYYIEQNGWPAHLFHRGAFAIQVPEDGRIRWNITSPHGTLQVEKDVLVGRDVELGVLVLNR